MRSERITWALDLQTIEYLPATLRGWLANDLSLHAAALHNRSYFPLRCRGWDDEERLEESSTKIKYLND